MRAENFRKYRGGPKSRVLRAQTRGSEPPWAGVENLHCCQTPDLFVYIAIANNIDAVKLFSKYHFN